MQLTAISSSHNTLITSLCNCWLQQRPKSENWGSLTPRSYTTVRRTEKSTDPGNSLASPWTIRRGVNSISLQCVLWPVACSEWGACLTDFDRSFRFSGSGIRTMIRIGLKSLSVCPCPDTCRHAKIHPNPCTHFWVILLTDRQTNIAGNHIYVLLCRR